MNYWKKYTLIACSVFRGNGTSGNIKLKASAAGVAGSSVTVSPAS